DGLALDRAQGDREGRSRGGAGNADEPAGGAWELRHEGEHHETAERGTHHGIEALDSERADDLVATARNVFYRQIGKSQTVGFAGGWIVGGGAGRAKTA